MGYSVDNIPYIPRLISDVANGDYELVSRYASLGLAITQTSGMAISVNCVDNSSFDIDLPTLNAPTELEKLLIDDTVAGVKEFSKLCQAWLPEFAHAEKRPAFASDIPTLLLAGELDPATPVSHAELAKDSLPNSYLYEFAGFGHSLTNSDANANGCVGKLMASFWNHPAAKPDDGCMTNLKPRKFITK
jgi:pimeloyl-ACP methyl ester carboxylesterase